MAVAPEAMVSSISRELSAALISISPPMGSSQSVLMDPKLPVITIIRPFMSTSGPNTADNEGPCSNESSSSAAGDRRQLSDISADCGTVGSDSNGTPASVCDEKSVRHADPSACTPGF